MTATASASAPQFFHFEGAEQLPETLRRIADRSCELLIQHLRSDLNAYGLPWDLSKSANGLKIWSSKIPGQSRRVWKSQFTFATDARLEYIIEETRDWTKRLKWDKSYSQGEILRTFKAGSNKLYDLSRSCSMAMAGISSREFLELRYFHPGLDGRTLLHTFTSVTCEDISGLPSPSKGLVHADGKAGTGVRWTRIEATESSTAPCWMVEIVVEADLKGWVPTVVLNSAMTLVYTQNHISLVKHFGNSPTDVSTPEGST